MLGRPADDLPPRWGVDQNGGRVAGRVGSAAPHDLPSIAIAGDERPALFQPHMKQHPWLVHHGCTSQTPGRQDGTMVFHEINRPNDCSRDRIQTVGLADRPKRVDAPLEHGRRGPRTGPVIEIGVRHRIGVRPEWSAGRRIETEHAFRFGRRFDVVVNIDPPVGHRDPRIAPADRLTKPHGKPRLGPLVQDVWPGPGLVTPRTTPAGPVLCECDSISKQRCQSQNQRPDGHEVLPVSFSTRMQHSHVPLRV